MTQIDKKLLDMLDKRSREKNVVVNKLDTPIPDKITWQNLAIKDARSLMDIAAFRLSKREKRIGEKLVYNIHKGSIVVSSGAYGMATVWDYDILLMAISVLTEKMNLYRKGECEKPTRVFCPTPSDILKFSRKQKGGRQKDEITMACKRLNTTHVSIQRVKSSSNGTKVIDSEGEPLITRYRTIKEEGSEKVIYIEIEIPNWIYKEIVSGKNPDVLTINPDYFLIKSGLSRFLYRLARRTAGKDISSWGFRKIYEHSGAASDFLKFKRMLRKIIKENNIPDYSLKEVDGKNEPLLVIEKA